jgi:asparagine synthase (glutamine-hydrolysing)
LFAAGVERRLNERHVADSTLINFTNQESSWFEGVHRVPLGSVVELERGRQRILRKVYDLLAMPDVRMGSDAEYIKRASELLGEGVRVCLAGFRRPGVALSSGLDSPQVACRALAALPAGQRLPTFTFHPEPGFDGRCEPGNWVTSARWSRYLPRCIRGWNRISLPTTAEHDHRWDEFFHLMGGAPSGTVQHVCLPWAFLRRGKRAATSCCRRSGAIAPSATRAAGVSSNICSRAVGANCGWRLPVSQTSTGRSCGAFLPESFCRCFQIRCGGWPGSLRSQGANIWLTSCSPYHPNIRSPLVRHSGSATLASSLSDTIRGTGAMPNNCFFGMVNQRRREVYQAFEQMYGLPLRDPMAYRPFVEFCLACPLSCSATGRVEMAGQGNGQGDHAGRAARQPAQWPLISDWLLRLKRRRADFIAEIDRLAEDERMAAMLDLPRMRAALEDLPDQTELDPQKYYSAEVCCSSRPAHSPLRQFCRRTERAVTRAALGPEFSLLVRCCQWNFATANGVSRPAIPNDLRLGPVRQPRPPPSDSGPRLECVGAACRSPA